MKKPDVDLIINKQLELNGYSRDILETKNWFSKYTTTQELEDAYKQFLIDYIRSLGYTKKEAIKEMSWIILGFGLRVE